jgi:hypothetical protein
MNIETELGAFSRCRARTLAVTAPLIQRQMDYVPQSGKWSVGEVLHHLFLTERTYRGDLARLIELKKSGKESVLKRSFSEIDVTFLFLPKFVLRWGEIPMGIFSSLMPGAIRDFMIRNRLIPFQNPSIATPRKGIGVDELRGMLRTSIAETESLIRSNIGLDFNSMVHKHPILGVNTATELVRIQESHEERHQSQINEIMSHRGFPSNS